MNCPTCHTPLRPSLVIQNLEQEFGDRTWSEYRKVTKPEHHAPIRVTPLAICPTCNFKKVIPKTAHTFLCRTR